MNLYTTKEALSLIKKHTGNIVVDAKIGDFGLYVKVAKNELISQLTYHYGDVTEKWLEVNNSEGDLEITYASN